MHPDRRIRLSKFLSLILRHRPEEVGLTLDPQGRVPLATLVEGLRARGRDDLRPEEVDAVVRLDPRRFAINDGLIRARYGHSLALEHPGLAVRPPEWLYYGIPESDLEAVRAQYVHLCQTPQEAGRRLQRHGISGHIITVFARRGHDQGTLYYQATDHLYLTSQVPPEFLHLPVALVTGPG